MAAEEFRVALKRNNKGLGIIFDEGDMSVKRVVTGCVAAEDGTIQHGDILLSVKRDDFPEVLAVQASEDLSVLFPPGDYLFEMRFLRTRPLREPSGAPTHALRGRSEWERPKRCDPSIIALPSFCSLQATGPHAFVHTPLDDKTACLRLITGEFAPVALEATKFSMHSALWLTTAEPSHLSSGSLPGYDAYVYMSARLHDACRVFHFL